jgi:6-pyruvoyltetrahydropterin/6-carboxytetrahydropterin synthase
MHGHNYEVEIEIDTVNVDEIGFVLDYRALDSFKRAIDELFDHKCINDVIDINPTAENIARYIWEMVHKGVDVALREKHGHYGLIIYVSETPKTWASFDGAT